MYIIWNKSIFQLPPPNAWKSLLKYENCFSFILNFCIIIRISLFLWLYTVRYRAHNSQGNLRILFSLYRKNRNKILRCPCSVSNPIQVQNSMYGVHIKKGTKYIFLKYRLLYIIFPSRRLGNTRFSFDRAMKLLFLLSLLTFCSTSYGEGEKYYHIYLLR